MNLPSNQIIRIDAKIANTSAWIELSVYLQIGWESISVPTIQFYGFPA